LRGNARAMKDDADGAGASACGGARSAAAQAQRGARLCAHARRFARGAMML